MKLSLKLKILCWSCLLLGALESVMAADYYFHPRLGSDQNTGLDPTQPFQNLEKVISLKLGPGDRILLAGGEVFKGSLELLNLVGDVRNPIIVEPYFSDDQDKSLQPLINAEGFSNGILIENSSYIEVRNIKITADGYGKLQPEGDMRVGVMIRAKGSHGVKGVKLDQLSVSKIFLRRKESREVRKKYAPRMEHRSMDGGFASSINLNRR